MIFFCLVCSLPQLRFTPNGNPMNNPLEYFHTENIFIDSTFELICNEKYSLTYQWIFYNCSYEYCTMEFSMNLTMNSHEIFIPKKSLSVGFYRLKLTIHTTNDVSIAQSIYLKIKPWNQISVYLLPTRTSRIIIGYQQDLLIQPGKYSIDFDEVNFIEQVGFDYFFFLKIRFVFRNGCINIILQWNSIHGVFIF